nr:hypothetical protein [uncultured bacterium]
MKSSLWARAARVFLMRLNKPYDDRYLFEEDGMLIITAGYTEATDKEGAHWTRLFAHHCPLCGRRIMPESASPMN